MAGIFNKKKAEAQTQQPSYATKADVILQRQAEIAAKLDRLLAAQGQPSAEAASVANQVAAVANDVAAVAGKTDSVVQKISTEASYLGKQTSAIFDKLSAENSGLRQEMGYLALQCENVFNRLPELRGQLNSINAMKLQAGTYAQCSYGLGRGGISVNTSYFSDVERLTKLYARDLEHGFHPAGTTFGSIVTHELGHAVDDYLSVIQQLAGLNGWRPKKVSAYLRPKVMKACGLKVSDTKTAVSGYATQDAQEWFAECFCEWMDSESPRPVAEEFGKQLLDLMKGMKTNADA